MNLSCIFTNLAPAASDTKLNADGNGWVGLQGIGRPLTAATAICYTLSGQALPGGGGGRGLAQTDLPGPVEEKS